MDGTHVIVMGVSGCGKSTVGKALADRLGRSFIEGDDHHPDANLAKMARGVALNNADRVAWISSICEAANETGVSVIACSALNGTVRRWLDEGLTNTAFYVWLNGDPDLLAQRLAARTDHFFDPALLASQFDALEPPEAAMCVSVDQSVEAIVGYILNRLDDK